MTFVGVLFFSLGAVQWFAPEFHRLTWLVSRTDASVAGDRAESDVKSIARAMAVARMYVAGLFLTLAWMPVFDRFYRVFVQLLPAIVL